MSQEQSQGLVKWEFEGKTVRTVVKNGETWFVAKDVFSILGLSHNARHLDKLEQEEKGVNIIHTLGGPQKVSIVSESGMYGLTFMSRKPEARRFRKWTTSEVLVSIRRTGGYINPHASSEQISTIMDRLLAMQTERDHWRRIASLKGHECQLWEAHNNKGDISTRNNLPKLKRRRGTWYADPQLRCDVDYPYLPHFEDYFMMRREAV